VDSRTEKELLVELDIGLLPTYILRLAGGTEYMRLEGDVFRPSDIAGYFRYLKEAEADRAAKGPITATPQD